MKKLAALALVSASLAAQGCATERVYDNMHSLEPALIGELFGQAGVLTPIEKQFAATTTNDNLFGMSDSLTVSSDGDSLYANMFVQDPERGRAYIDVNITNFDRMEPGQPYTVEVQGEDGRGGYYASDSVDADEPIISVYACPEDLNGPTGQSGNAEVITVVREQGPNGDVFKFDAQADNPRQELFLDGWFRTGPTAVSGF